MKWTRPSSVPYPSVWASHTGRRALPGGRVPHFRIQDAPEEMIDEIVEHMKTYFLKDEPISAETRLIEDHQALEEMIHLCREMLKQKVTIVALDVAEDGTTKLAGVNVAGISEEESEQLTFKSLQLQKIFGLIKEIHTKAPIFSKYRVEQYLGTLGLSVAPKYRGQGLGLEILKARVPLCKAMGLKLTASVFSAENAQELARRAGFELLHEIEYANYRFNGQVALPGLRGKLFKSMALKIE